MIYEKTADIESNINNIKELFLSEIYLNGYQYVWFTNKLRTSLDLNNYLNKSETYSESEIQSWLDTYKEKSNENKLKQNKYPADRFTKKNSTVSLLSEEQFNFNQKSYEHEQIGRIYESVKNYELAINHYKKVINDDYPTSYKIYQRLCYVLEKIPDYEEELNAIKLYYVKPPISVTEYSDEWFEKRLNKVNKELNTNYTSDDLKK